MGSGAWHVLFNYLGSIDQIPACLCAMRYTFDYLPQRANGKTDDIRVMEAKIDRALMIQTLLKHPH